MRLLRILINNNEEMMRRRECFVEKQVQYVYVSKVFFKVNTIRFNCISEKKLARQEDFQHNRDLKKM